MTEKLCLQWNDFQENMKSTFVNLRGDKHFSDVTLVSEDGQQMEAHRVILAASSLFFKMLLEGNQHPHPLIYMRGVKSEDLLAIVDFLYCGEANVFQENLDSFLAIAEELQLKGLMGKNDGKKVEDVVAENKSDFKMSKPIKTNSSRSIVGKTQTAFQKRQIKIEAETKFQKRQSKNEAETNNVIALSSIFSGNIDELEERVKSLMEKSPNNYGEGNRKADKCKVCGKEGKGSMIKNHIEVNHLEGIVLPCNQCEKTFSTQKNRKEHTTRNHQIIS